MQRFSAPLALCAIPLFFAACEMHSASELPPENEHRVAGDEPKTEPARVETKPEEKGGAAARLETEGKPAEAPKFFPEKK